MRKSLLALTTGLIVAAVGYASATALPAIPGFSASTWQATTGAPVVRVADEGPKDGTVSDRKTKAVAIFASGCFWCTESDYDKVPGVLSTISGYIGGTTVNPTYKQVTSGGTGHTEAVQVTYDPAKVSYEQLVEHYWRHVDMFDLNGQFCDRGDAYRPAIFTLNETQKQIALASRAALNASGKFKQKIEVPIEDPATFYTAEHYHQDYYKNNAWHYKRYRIGCGRDARIEQIWGKTGS